MWDTIDAAPSVTQLVVSPSFGAATTTSAWEIAIGDWFLQCDADTTKTWYKILDVASPTSLIASPAYPSACTGAYLARSSPGHPKRPTPGVHRPNEALAPGAWNSGSSRHVTCADCHNNHALQATG